ncbi:MAG: peptidoglycan editing factor PgeF [Betaproteobacteria bacterium]|jgi:polyphenol oxidase
MSNDFVQYGSHSWPANWLIPKHLPNGVRAVCTTREGGESKVPYESFNLGNHVGDDEQHVKKNRQHLQSLLGVRPVFLKQVHAWDVIEISNGIIDDTVADVCFTSQKQIACTIMVADCLPVLAWNSSGTWVGAAHAGWRGLLGSDGRGVFEVLVSSLPNHVKVSDLHVWLGPCIGPTAFEVGEDVYPAFVSQSAQSHNAFVPHQQQSQKWWADLQSLARKRLQHLGVQHIDGNDGSSDWCTVLNRELFFSHRRDKVSGRFAACIWIDT